ncbi:MAG: polysaccharide biosynthesis tyrosine autokinase [Phycisphaerales bacterium]|nr:MAG: polysaccharide biosynthesis tyrosine autokinase [Phycisphaerales bacterium]
MTTPPNTALERFAPSATAVGPGPSAAPADIIAMLRSRTVLIVVLFVLTSIAVVAGYILWARYLPGYRSECLIECVSNIPEAELTFEQERLKQEEHERFVLTQAILLKSPGILSEALKVRAVRDTNWWEKIQAKRVKQENEHLIQLTEELHAAPVRGTNFLRVSMVCRAKEDPAVIVNEVVRQWYDFVNRRAAEEFASKSLETAQTELEELEARIEERRQNLRILAGRLPAGARQAPGSNVVAQQVVQYGEQVASLSLELAQLEQYRTIYNDPETVAVTAEDRAMVEQDPQVAQLAQAVFLYEQQRVADEKVFGADHSVLRALDAQLEAAEDKLANLRIEKLRERREDIREATNTAYLNTQHALFLAQENLARAEAALQDQEQLLFNYLKLEEELAQDEEYRIELDTYIKSLGRVVRQQSAVKINIAQPAIDPLERHSPNIVVVPLGFFVALLVSIGIGLGLEVIDTSVRTLQDIGRHVGVAMLGAIPDTNDEEVAIQRVETAVLDSPRSMVAEAYRRIWTNLQFSAPAEQRRSLLVTSPRAEEGATTVACNLAVAMAQRNRRVLLIDANFRRPRLQKLFNQTDKQGLSNVLIGSASLQSCVAQSGVASLDVLGSGPIPPNPVELLAGEVCEKLIAEAVAQYDQVIIDTAPLLLASDALTLSSAADGVVLVLRAKRSTRGIARRARTLLGDVGAHLFGAVLNAAQVTRGGYFREQLRAYYDYQADADEAQEVEAKDM